MKISITIYNIVLKIYNIAKRINLEIWANKDEDF